MPPLAVKDIETEEKSNEGDQTKDQMTVTEKAGELNLDNRAGKTEVCLVEGEWAKQEVSVWEEDINEEGVRWFSSVVEEYEKKKQEERIRVFERVRTQSLMKDFLNLKVGGLLPDPEIAKEKASWYMTKEWTVIVAPRELELQREKRSFTTSFP